MRSYRIRDIIRKFTSALKATPSNPLNLFTDFAYDMFLFLVRGFVINLWPEGYKKEIKICCPSMELHQYVHDNYLDEVKASMPIKKKFLDKANEAKANIAAKIDLPIDDVTFIGLHDR